MKNASAIMPRFDYTVSAKEYFEHLEMPLKIMQTSNHSTTEHPMHIHEFTELTIVTRGHAIHKTSLGAIPLQAGDVFIIYRGEAHGFTQMENFSLINILFNEKRLPLPLWDFGMTPFARLLFQTSETCGTIMQLSPETLSTVKKLADEIVLGDSERKNCFRFRGMALFMLLLTELGRSFSENADDSAKTFNTVADALDFLEIHFNEDIDLDRLASTLFMSRRNFFRNFKKSTGTTPMHYLIRIRLRHALKLLRESSLSLDEIALRCGFKERQIMAYHFRMGFQRSPLAIRRDR